MSQWHALQAPTPHSPAEVHWWPEGPVRPVVAAHRTALDLIGYRLPPEPTGLLGWRIRRRCRAEGGHWWHPADAMIEWGCCNCGARRDGMPTDGT